MKKTTLRALGLTLTTLLLATTGVSGAQLATPSATTTRAVSYDILKLQVQPQVIDIYPNMKTPVFFDDQLLEIVSGNPELFNLDINANRTGFYISATGPAGMTDLYVTTASNITAMFIIKLHPVGLQPQRIEVRVPRTAYEGTERTAASAWTGGVGVPQNLDGAVPTARQLNAMPIKVETVSAPAANVAPATVTKTTTVQTTTTATPAVVAKPGLSFKTSREGNTLKVDYTITPEVGGTFNPAKTTVKAGDKDITYRLIRRGGLTERAISAALPEQAVLAIDNFDTHGPVTVTWVLSTSTGDKTYTETFR